MKKTKKTKKTKNLKGVSNPNGGAITDLPCLPSHIDNPTNFSNQDGIGKQSKEMPTQSAKRRRSISPSDGESRQRPFSLSPITNTRAFFPSWGSSIDLSEDEMWASAKEGESSSGTATPTVMSQMSNQGTFIIMLWNLNSV